MENSLEVLLKIVTVWSNNPTSRSLFKRIENRILKGYLCNHDCSIHSSQEVEITLCLSTDECVKRMWYTHTIKYYSALQKKEILYILQHDEPWEYCVKWNKLITQRQILHDPSLSSQTLSKMLVARIWEERTNRICCSVELEFQFSR